MSEKIYTGDDYNDVLDFEFYMDMFLELDGLKQATKFHYEWLTGLGKQKILKGQYLLEIGTATMLHNAAVMAPFYEHIVLTDHAEKPRNWLYNWWQGKPSLTQRKIIQQVLDIEGTGQSVEEREKEIQRKIIAIVPSNVMIPDPLSPCSFKAFDTVIMKWVFDAAVSDENEYMTALENVASLLRKGGELCVLGITSRIYKIKDVTFQGMDLSVDTVRRVWEKSPFELLSFQSDSFKFGDVSLPICNILGRKK